MPFKYLEKIIFKNSDSVRKVISAFNNTAIHTNKSGFAIIVNSKNVCVGVLTDGDIRRKLLDGLSIDDSIEKFLNKNFEILHDSFSKTIY